MDYDRQTQEMFWLGFLSNCGTKCPDDQYSDIYECVLAKIQAQLGTPRVFLKNDINPEQDLKDPRYQVTLSDDWEIVWLGVAVIPSDHDHDNGPYPTNTMFVARQKSNRSTFFISVAGTDSKSFFDTLEDFRVHELRTWPHAKENSRRAQPPLISLGFHKGLEVLEHMRSKELQGQKRTLDEFFAGVVRDVVTEADGRITIITGGHSQGGSLSPLVALWLIDIQDSWDPRGLADISSWPFAGPSPGNQVFADYYDERVPNTTSVINPLDIAVKFYNEGDLKTLEKLYEPDEPPTNDEPTTKIEAGPRITHLANFLIADTNGKGYTRIPQDPGKVVQLGSSVDPTLIDPQKTDCINYTMQAGYQHIKAYFDLLGVAFDDLCGIDQLTGLCQRPVVAKILAQAGDEGS